MTVKACLAPRHTGKAWALLFFLLCSSSAFAASLQDIKTVFLIVMENQPWSHIKGNPACPYINRTLLPQAGWCEHYYSPPDLHPTLPNYLWLVAGTNFGLHYNPPPWEGLQDTTNHLAFLLDQAGIPWKHYQVGIAGLSYPPTNIVYPYHTAFNPFLYFRNVLTNTAYCQAHIRPYEEFAPDLTNQNVGRFNIISPGLWYSMHDSGPPGGDAWLATEVPRILSSAAYQDGGALFITWDEDDYSSIQGAIGMMVLSPLARGGGYWNSIPYTHSSTLRTMQDIFGVQPYLGDAANATSLEDFFHVPPPQLYSFVFQPVVPNRSYYLQTATDVASTVWQTLSTNVALTNTMDFVAELRTNELQRFFRLSETPP